MMKKYDTQYKAGIYATRKDLLINPLNLFSQSKFQRAMKFQAYLSLILMLAIGLASCEREDACQKSNQERVLLVYVGTDNNLAGFEQDKLQAIRDGWDNAKNAGMIGENDRVIVYRDTRNADARLMEISNLKPGESPRVIATYYDDNSASADVLARVIGNVVAMYPNAESYGLLVFSHASGWLPRGALSNPYKNFPLPSSSKTRSVVVDGSQEMELVDFAAAIPSGVFDYIVFEMCFMAGIEVAYELRNKADYIFASSAEIVHPGFATAYPTATQKLIAGNLSAFGQNVFSHVLEHADDDYKRSATYSVISTAGLEELATFVRGNCDFNKDIRITDIQHFDRNSNRLFFDFGDYYGRLLNTDAQRAELEKLIDKCIIWKASTPEFMTQSAGLNGFKINKHSGLTTYIPQSHLPGLNTIYNELSWYKSAIQ